MTGNYFHWQKQFKILLEFLIINKNLNKWEIMKMKVVLKQIIEKIHQVYSKHKLNNWEIVLKILVLIIIKIVLILSMILIKSKFLNQILSF